MCDHKFVYGGVKYEYGEDYSIRSGVNECEYYDWFFCEKCLANRYKKLNVRGVIRFTATPK